MKIDAKVVFLCLACLVGGWWLSGGESSSTVKPQRPVLKFLGRAARTLLWVSLFVEKTPDHPPATYAHARFDEAGQPLLDHARGW